MISFRGKPTEVVEEGVTVVAFEQKEEKELTIGRSGKRVSGRRYNTCKGPEVGISKV